MEIKRVTIGYLNEGFKTGIVCEGKTLYKLERENIGERVCIIDKDKAIDINDFDNEYEIIIRDEYNRIANKDISFLTIYAFEMTPIDKKEEKSYKKRIKQYKKNIKD
jgi:hypothetical protein